MYFRRILSATRRTRSGAVASEGTVRRRRPRAYLAGTTGLLALLVLIVGGTALGSSVSSASFTAGGAVVSGTRYAKQGQTITLTVATSSDTKCVQITGAHTAKQRNNTAQSSWTFNFTAGSGDGLQTVTAAASPNFNATNCTGQSADACFDCCNQASGGALAIADNIFGQCACGTGGQCTAFCDANLCSGITADSACASCLQATCKPAETAACTSAACKAGLQCAQQCQ